jgi:hypothetical protein
MTTEEIHRQLEALRQGANHTVVDIDIFNWDAEVSAANAAMNARHEATGLDQSVEFRPVDRRQGQPHRSTYHQVQDGVWEPSLPAMNACCDCGLTHSYEYRIVGAPFINLEARVILNEVHRLVASGQLHIEVRSWTNTQATARVRETQNHPFKKLDSPTGLCHTDGHGKHLRPARSQARQRPVGLAASYQRGDQSSSHKGKSHKGKRRRAQVEV